MNSDVVNKIIHIINPTANNSSNYVKQIPYKEPDENEFDKICALVHNELSIPKSDTAEAKRTQNLINSYFNNIYAA